MSQNFKLKFDELREGKPTEKGETVENSYETFDMPGHSLNFCFVGPDGKMNFFKYAYLVSREYLPDDGSVTLVLQLDTVVIRNISLKTLFDRYTYSCY